MRWSARSVGRMLAIGGCLSALLLCAPAQAFGHVPVLEPRERSTASAADRGVGGAREVEPPDESRAIYGTLHPAERLDSYSFTAPGDITTTIEVLVPASVGGAGTDPALRFSVVDVDAGDVSPAPLAGGETFFEPFSMQRFEVVARLPYRFEEGSFYALVVESAERERERRIPYVIAFSGAERFGGSDVLASAVYVPRIWFGLYGQWAPRWGMIAIAATLFLAVGYGIVRAVRRRRPA